MSLSPNHRPSSFSVCQINSWPTRHTDTGGHHGLGKQLPDALLLDELRRLSQSNSGWVLLIAPPGLPVAKQLQAQGINPARVLVIHREKIKSWQRMLELSLNNGHYAAVLAWLPEQIALDRIKLRQLGQHFGVLTHFFEPKDASLPILSEVIRYGGQDIYLSH